jgi:hypothetical protein
MHMTSLIKPLLTCCAGCTILTSAALAQGAGIRAAKETRAPEPASYAQIQIPNRPFTSLFQGEQGKQKTEIYFDTATHLVTVSPAREGGVKE